MGIANNALLQCLSRRVHTGGRQCYGLHTAFLARGTFRQASTWNSIPELPSADIEQFRKLAFEPERPARLPRGAIDIDARGTWLSGGTPPDELNILHLRKYVDSLHLPMEMTVPGTEIFHRAEAVPFQLFLDAIEGEQMVGEHGPRIYIAQCPLQRLPTELRAPFTTPIPVLQAGKGDVYDSSLWLGLPPTSTPLHRDPNPNMFVQVAGRKAIRLMPPEIGSQLYHDLRAGKQGGGFGSDERMRGEEMMKGDEKELLEKEVWSDKVTPADCYEATLGPGDSLFIPKGWWHAVRGTGDGINMSVNWWFR